MTIRIRIRYNDDNDDLWCLSSKERIPLGSKYIEITENYFGERITKTYLPDYAPETEEYEDESEEEEYLEDND